MTTTAAIPMTMSISVPAPAPAVAPAPAPTMQDIQAKIASVMTPEDRDMFVDLMDRVAQVMTDDEKQAMQSMSQSTIGALCGSTSVGFNLPAPGTIGVVDPIEDDFVAPGYNAMDKEMALELVAEHVSGEALKIAQTPRVTPLMWGDGHFTPIPLLPPGPSLTRVKAPMRAQIEHDWAPTPTKRSSYIKNLSIEACHSHDQLTGLIDGVPPDHITTMLSGAHLLPPAGYYVRDDRIGYYFTAQEVDDYLDEQEQKSSGLASVNAYQGGTQLGQYTPTSAYGSLGSGQGNNSWRNSYRGIFNDDHLRDPADTIGGFNPDKVKEEQLIEQSRQLRIGQMRGNWKIVSNAGNNFMATAVAQKVMPPNILTGVPDPLPDAVADVQLNLDALQDIVNLQGQQAAQDVVNNALASIGSDLAIAPAPTPPPRMTDTYVPARPLEATWGLFDLLAECRRLFDFCVSHVHPRDSEMTGVMLEMTELFSQYTPRTADELIEAKDLILPRIHAVHQTLAISVPLPDHYLPSAAQLNQQTVQQTVAQVTTIGTTKTNTSVTINSAAIQGVQVPVVQQPSSSLMLPAGVSAYVQSPNITNPQIGGVGQLYGPPNVAINHTPWPFQGAGENPAYDRSFKLLPGHVYLLDDGSKIEVDAVGNYTVHDAEGKITYRATRMREFNRYVNGSDLIGEFIEDLGKLGASQNQAAITPIEMFIRWLIFKAAEHDREEPPEDVPPLSAAEIPPDPVKEVVRESNAAGPGGPIVFETSEQGERARVTA